MPVSVDADILAAVRTVYTTHLGLPEDWTDEQRAGFISTEADKITWMVRAEASVISDRLIAELCRRSGGASIELKVRTDLMAAARVQAFDRVFSTELYELIAHDTDDL